jgi:hypothetical protein
MGDCVNCGKKGCNPRVNSECVTYNGNFISNGAISKGDNLTVVIQKLSNNVGGGGGNTSGVNLPGAGAAVFTSKAGDNLQFRKLTNGVGVSVVENGNNILITNTSPDQVVSLTAGSNVSITGSYPNFTIASTASGGSGGGAGQGNLFS